MRFAALLDSTISFFWRQLKVAPGGRLDIICLPFQPSLEATAGGQNCGCSSVVERLVANEKVASSTLVTRSSPESFRGWSECAEAWRRRTAQKILASESSRKARRLSRTGECATQTMHQWSKLADLRWLTAHEYVLQSRARGRLVIISRPGHKRLKLEITCTSRNLAQKLIDEFGGRVEKWPRDWLKRFENIHKSTPLKIGTRLIVTRSINDRQQRCSVRCHQRLSPVRHARDNALRTAHATVSGEKTNLLVIPASAAFGTGEHATTGMSLRLLERLSREWEKGWSLADLGTGSGILALAAKRFGAGRVTGIDIDPKAISIANANARLNKIDKANFQLADVRRWKPESWWDVIAGNLYGDLLIEILPKLKRTNWLIFSGVLRSQKDELLRALRRNNMEIASLKHRGKWIAVAAYRRNPG